MGPVESIKLNVITPNQFSTQVIIEAKITKDNGAAHDKGTRLQPLSEFRMVGQPAGQCR